MRMPRLFTLFPLWIVACEPTKVQPSDPSSEGGEDTHDPSEEQDSAEPDPYADALPPVAQISGSVEAIVGESLTLDGSGSFDPQGFALVDYAWSCSDGTTGAEPTLSLSFAEAGAFSCTLDVTSASGLSGSGSVDLTVDEPRASWTILVFMNGDNELESAAIEDLNEMEMAGSTDEVNIVVQIDRSSGFDRTNDNWTGARRYRVEQDNDPEAIGSTVLEDLGSVDSGEPETVSEFVAWAAAAYPAEHTALVLWDHGWGWSFAPGGGEAGLTKGISSDYSSGNDISIAEGELAEILEAAVAATGEPLAIMGFDACIMASWEVAYESAPYAGVMVSSQDYESEDGWDYDNTLGDLIANPAMSPAELAESVSLRFYESRDSTQSAVDLAGLAALNTALDGVADAILALDDPKTLFSDSAHAALDWDGGRGVDRDLGQVLDNLAAGTDDAALIDAALAAHAALDAVVLSNYTYGRVSEGATGLNLYAPYRGTVDPLYLEGSWADGTRWDDMLVEVFGSR